MIKNDLYLRALRGEHVERPPVWMMRQAGRYLPEFMELKEKYDFFTRCQTPELAAEITLQPIERYAPDAAILFSDILVVPQAMGIDVQMVPGTGPFVPQPIRSRADVSRIEIPDVEEELSYVYQAIELTLKGLDNRVPLIGFAGSPWTIFCYVVQGQGSKNFDIAKAFAYSQSGAALDLLQKITETTLAYLKRKARSGVHAIQIFDSWGGLLDPAHYNQYSLPFIKQLVDGLKDEIPVIVFAKGCWYALEDMSRIGAQALGVDWTCSPEWARKLTGNNITLQGNLDPSILLSSVDEIREQTEAMIRGFGTQRYIANLGHGILPNVPLEHAEAFFETVKNFKE
jgi:uroporphyrinogen decarboxylase